jgi:hypothetical protein
VGLTTGAVWPHHCGRNVPHHLADRKLNRCPVLCTHFHTNFERDRGTNTGVTTADISALSTTQLGYFTAAQVPSFTATQLNAMSSGQVGAL